METSLLWAESVKLPKFPALRRNLTLDAVVIGGGFTGLSTAYLLKKAGLRVGLLERERCGGVDTPSTTAHLTCVTDTRLHELVNRVGRDRARGTWEAGFAAIDQIVANIQAEEIDCDLQWVPGYLHAPGTKNSGTTGARQDLASLQKDAALARDLGFAAEFVEAVPHFGTPGVRFDHQARFHPLKYLRALAQAIPGSGSHIFEHSAAVDITEKPLTVATEKHSIRCRRVFLATHTPMMGKDGLVAATLLMTKLYLYSSYALAAKVKRGAVPDALFWDTALPYKYLRLQRQRQFDLAILGGEDHKTGQDAHTLGPFRRLERSHRWSGQVIETHDGLPIIGESSPGQFVATGFAGNGMTFGTLAAMMARDVCLRRKNPWAELFSPHRRVPARAAWHYLQENKDYPYYLVRNWLAGAEGKTLRGLRRGAGKILNLDGRKVAAYRDETGEVTLCSPICTHLKCIVAWNEAEQTWDCPCHGSRFKPTGEVLAGPAERPLEKIEAKPKTKA